MNSGAPAAAQRRFHRYVAVLLAATVPVVAIVELMTSVEWTTVTLLRLVGSLILASWSVVIARSKEPNAIPIVLGTMVLTGGLVVEEALFGADLTAFDFSAAFGLMMLFAVLVGTLSIGSRLVWAAGLAFSVAAWVLLVGILNHDSLSVLATRGLVALAGVALTTALVGELFNQLNRAIAAYDRSRRLQEAVAYCSEALLVHPRASALEAAARALLDATDADYAYIDRTISTSEGPGWEILAGARRGDREEPGWRTGIYAGSGPMYQALSRGDTAKIQTDELSGPERALYEEDGIMSEVCVPIFVGEVFRGSIGFVDYVQPRVWSDDEVQTLWRAADMIGALWKRQDDGEALERSNEEKDKLLASVSHELRTPLTAIVGLSEEIAANRLTLGHDEIDELTGIIAVQSRELAELVEDLLVASRADFGNLSIRPEAVDLRSQVEMVVGGVHEALLGGRNISVTGGEVRAWADPLRVRQIVRNLVTNALKYGGDMIEVVVTDVGGPARVVVTDNGAGVADHEATLIFERYYRSRQTPTQPGSVGIGLSVSRQLAELMDGTLEYLPATGVTGFELSLPPVNEPARGLVSEPV
ncbi:MAG: HAMP domain-containing sensor histidine kinase [Acidimicrobiia bacterium]